MKKYNLDDVHYELENLWSTLDAIAVAMEQGQVDIKVYQPAVRSMADKAHELEHIVASLVKSNRKEDE